jgi:hypothetical protein
MAVLKQGVDLMKATFKDFSRDEATWKAAALAYITVFALPSSPNAAAPGCKCDLGSAEGRHQELHHQAVPLRSAWCSGSLSSSSQSR